MPRPIRRSDWSWLWTMTLLATLALVVLLGVLACSNGNGSAPTVVAPEPDPAAMTCDETKLAARDLAGQCRATPQATMGALEALPG